PEARDAGAVVAALVFAVHPLRVEAVTWLTGRRDVLSGFWFLVTLLCYLRAAATEGRPRRGWLAGSIAAFALALLAKAVVMVTPIVLVVLDIYPLRRLPGNPRRWAEPAARRTWAEKVPFVVLAAGGAVAAGRAVAAYRGQGQGSGGVL